MSRRTKVIGVSLALPFLLMATNWSAHGQGADPQMESAFVIVAYREQHGPFRTWQDLERVPGIDFKKVRERSEILFAD